MDKIWTTAIEMAFGDPGQPMIEAQQNMLESLDAVDLDEVDPVLLPMDSATVRCRRVLDGLRREDGVKLPDPRNPALTDLNPESGGRGIQRQDSSSSMTR